MEVMSFLILKIMGDFNFDWIYNSVFTNSGSAVFRGQDKSCIHVFHSHIPGRSPSAVLLGLQDKI